MKKTKKVRTDGATVQSHSRSFSHSVIVSEMQQDAGDHCHLDCLTSSSIMQEDDVFKPRLTQYEILFFFFFFSQTQSASGSEQEKGRTPPGSRTWQ